MCERLMGVAYSMYLSRERPEVSIIEKYINYPINGISVSVDDVRNESEIYAKIFRSRQDSFVYGLFLRLLGDLKGRPREDASDVIGGLEFIQEIGARGLWPFGLHVSADFEDFIRAFDRLDVAEERERLYVWAQTVVLKSTP